MWSCGCGKIHARLEASGDMILYLGPRPVWRPVFYCVTSCGRPACCASNERFADHCCQRCGETDGREHTPLCDSNWAVMRPRITTFDQQFSAGDIPLVKTQAMLEGGTEGWV